MKEWARASEGRRGAGAGVVCKNMPTSMALARCVAASASSSWPAYFSTNHTSLSFARKSALPPDDCKNWPLSASDTAATAIAARAGTPSFVAATISNATTRAPPAAAAAERRRREWEYVWALSISSADT